MPKKFHRRCDNCHEWYSGQAVKFCSPECYRAYRGKNPVNLSDSTRKKLSDRMLSDRNPMWKGDGVGLNALHRWVEKRIKKPDVCELCGKDTPVDLANKGAYNRCLSNWEWLCRRCHMLSDGRMKNLKNAR